MPDRTGNAPRDRRSERRNSMHSFHQMGKRDLNFCRMQILVTQGGNMVDFFEDNDLNITAQYYRLELDAQ